MGLMATDIEICFANDYQTFPDELDWLSVALQPLKMG